MAAVAKLRSGRHAAFQLKPVLPHCDYSTVRFVTEHTTAGTTAGGLVTTFSCKQDLPFSPDDTNIERIIHVLSDFSEARSDGASL